MIDDQLTASVEKISERLLAVRPVENILFVDLDHREFAPRCTERVTLPREFLLAAKQIFASNEPLSPRHDFRMIHLVRFYFGFHLFQFHFLLL